MGAVRARKKHLWVVISDTKKHAGCGLIVNISTDDVRADGECPLAANEHPWLSEPVSWVCYADATLMTVPAWAAINEGIAKGMIIPERKCPTSCLEKIIAGAKASAAKQYGAFRKDYLKYLD